MYRDKEWFKTQRQALGYKTQKEMAEAIGVNPSSVSRWESGRCPVPKKVIRWILDKIGGCEVEQIKPLRVVQPQPEQQVLSVKSIYSEPMEMDGVKVTGFYINGDRNTRYMTFTDMGLILGYSRPEDVKKLYKSHLSELSPHVIRVSYSNRTNDLIDPQGVKKLLMFSRAKNSQEYRDILVKEPQRPPGVKFQHPGGTVGVEKGGMVTPLNDSQPKWVQAMFTRQQAMFEQMASQGALLAQMMQGQQQAIMVQQTQIQEIQKELDRVSDIGNTAVKTATDSVRESFVVKEKMAALIIETRNYVGELVKKPNCPNVSAKFSYSGTNGYRRFISDCKKAAGISNWKRAITIGSVEQWEKALKFSEHVVVSLGGSWPLPNTQLSLGLEVSNG